jgi:hypothetical protein
MHSKNIATIGTLALALSVAACNRGPAADAVAPVDTTAADRAAELQKERDNEVARLNERVAALEADYAKKNAEVVTGAKVATSGLREELKEDVANVREAVGDLSSTTPDNWWDRHEHAMRTTAADIESDVKRLAGPVVIPAEPPVPADTASAAPFTSRRDAFVAGLKMRIEAFNTALDRVKAKGARETEVEVTRARVKKLAEDADKLASASADEWWDVTKARVTDYVDRVEASVKRLDDNNRS